MKVFIIILFSATAFCRIGNGQTVIWEQTNWPGSAEWVECLDQKGQTMAIGTADHGVYLSRDAGNSWKQTPIEGISVSAIAIKEHYVFAVTTTGLLRLDLTDNTLLTILNKARTIVIRNSVLYVDGVLHSFDNGLSWIPDTITTSVLALTNADSAIFAGTAKGVWKINDNGKSQQIGLKALQIQSIASSGQTIFAGASKDGGLFRSTNNGNSWSRCDSGFSSWTIQAMAMHNSTIFVSTDSAFYRSTDNGDSWLELWKIAGPTMLTYNGFSLYEAHRYFGLRKSTDLGTTWTSLKKGIASGGTGSIFSNGDTVYVGDGVGLVATTDQGNAWADFNGDADSLFVQHSRSIVKHNTFIIRGGNGGVRRSSDNGETWEVKNIGLGNNPAVLCLLLINNTIYAGLLDYVGSFGGLYKSTNDGDSWDSVAFGYVTISNLAVIGNDILLGSPDSGVYRSSNAGKSWRYRGKAEHYVTDFEVDGSVLYMSTADAGVYYSSDLGDHWIEIDSGLGTMHIQSLHLSGSTLYAGTIDKALYKTDIASISRSVPQYSTIGSGITVYPNPSSDKFYVSIPDHDLQGEYRLHDDLGNITLRGHCSPGQFAIDIGAIPSGLYNLLVKSNAGILSTKVIVVH